MEGGMVGSLLPVGELSRSLPLGHEGQRCSTSAFGVALAGQRPSTPQRLNASTDACSASCFFLHYSPRAHGRSACSSCTGLPALAVLPSRSVLAVVRRLRLPAKQPGATAKPAVSSVGRSVQSNTNEREIERDLSAPRRRRNRAAACPSDHYVLHTCSPFARAPSTGSAWRQPVLGAQAVLWAQRHAQHKAIRLLGSNRHRRRLK